MITTTTGNEEPSAGAGLPGTMRAVTQRRYGDSSVLSIESLERPDAGPGEVLIEVHAAGLDRGTEHLMTGEPWLVRLGFGLTRPKSHVPGLDVAGVVRAVGADVTRFEVGDAVFGIADGSFAEFAVAEEVKLSHKPENVSFEQAAASAVSGITALQALTDVGGVVAGQRVLVVGASGGVGSFAVQIARAMGTSVDGIAGARNMSLVEGLGAERVYDHRATDLDDIDRTYDLIIDIGGRNPLRKLRHRLEPTGTLVIVGGEDGNRLTGGFGRSLRAAALSPFVKHRLAMLISKEHHSFIDRLATLLESGDVVPVIGSRFPLEQAGAAMHQLESGQAAGKTLIQVNG